MNQLNFCASREGANGSPLRAYPSGAWRFFAALALVMTLGSQARADGSLADARVLLIGDSNIFGSLGCHLQEEFEALGASVIRVGKPTSGLARPDFFDWFARADALLREYEPSVVVFMFGGNDGQLLRTRDASERSVFWSNEHLWRATYEERIRRFAQLLRGDGRRVLLLSPTNRRHREARQRMQRVRKSQARAARAAGVEWVDMWPASSDASGRWLRWGRDSNGRRLQLRRSDGIHLTPEGGREVARRVTPTLVATLAAAD